MPSVTVPAGSPNITVTGAFPALYQLLLTPHWNAGGPFPTAQSTVAWTVAFPTPPFVDSLLDYTVTVGAAPPSPPVGITSTLGDYLDELRDILHDPHDDYWSKAQKVKYINRAMKQRDLDTGGNRIMQPLTLTTGVAIYDFSALPNPNFFDIININMIWSSTRRPMWQGSKVKLDATFRSLVNLQDMPWGWARLGPSTVYFAPTPNMAYDTEWDCAVVGPPLVDDADVDVLPYPYTKPVVYYAAYRAKLNERQNNEAGEFLAQYQTNCLNIPGTRTGMVPQVSPAVLR